MLRSCKCFSVETVVDVVAVVDAAAVAAFAVEFVDFALT